MPAPEAIQQLVENFATHIEHYKSSGYNGACPKNRWFGREGVQWVFAEGPARGQIAWIDAIGLQMGP